MWTLSPSFLKGRKNFGCCTIFEAKSDLGNKKKKIVLINEPKKFNLIFFIEKKFWHSPIIIKLAYLNVFLT